MAWGRQRVEQSTCVKYLVRPLESGELRKGLDSKAAHCSLIVNSRELETKYPAIGEIDN